MARLTKARVAAIAYLRTSSATNVGADKDSDKRQRQAIEAYARHAGHELVGEFYDKAVSGADPIETRPGFAAMLERIESNGVRTIIVETANRFARDLMVQEVGYARLQDRGITLIAADSPNAFQDDTPTAKLSITHNSGGSKFRTEFDIGESCEAAPDDDDAGRGIACARKVAPKAGKFDDVECQRSDFASSIAGVGDEAIENPDLTPGQSDVRRLVWRRPRHHRQPQNSPAQNAEHGHQVGETVSSAQLRVLGATAALQDLVEDLDFPTHCVPIDFFYRLLA